ncbi:MAG: DUF3892 domain-containing protein [Actinobacteria bacterium HGW-Actinobacteria-4]|nr:MAG: DUF3892 domain-containing protein [Actinobacteria bacterium HGW-Actinobacteria-4]
MARAREVKATAKDTDGDVTGLVGRFGRVTAKQAIRDIERGDAKYSSGGSALHVVDGPSGKYLRTSPDGRRGNNLDELPDA